MKPVVRIFLVDDNKDHILLLKKTLQQDTGHDYLFNEFSDGQQALKALPAESPLPDLVILDYKIPGKNGIEILRELRQQWSTIPVLMVTSYASIEIAVTAIKEGAFDYLTKPFREPKEVLLSIEKALRHRELVAENTFLRSQMRDRLLPKWVVGESKAVQKIQAIIDRIAGTNSTVLLTGESGTGKDVLARTLHAKSPRCGYKFLAVNCSAFPENLLESELFGHVKGAFTGAIANKVGLLKEAHLGTFFFDEIAELPMTMQTKLLRFLQDQEIRQTGSVRSEVVDVRIIAATNHDLHQAVEGGRFREDLFYRLNVIQIRLPPLRERKGDLALFIEQFIQNYNQREKRHIRGITPQALALLEPMEWPGNIRQLKNVIERAFIFTDGDWITEDSLAFLKPDPARIAIFDDEQSFAKARKNVLSNFTSRYLDTLLRKHKGNVTLAAATAKVGRQNFHRLMKLHRLRAQDYR